MPTVKLYGKKDIRAAAYNRSAANYFLTLSENEIEGRFFSTQASIMFSAFTHEAFINSLGSKVLSDWHEHEYKNVFEKLNLICAKLNYKPNKGKRPYQSLKRLFQFRNLVAHGRDETIQFDGTIVQHNKKGIYLDSIQGEWEKYCTVAYARKVYDDVREIAIDLLKRAPISSFPAAPFGNPASGLFKVEDNDT